MRNELIREKAKEKGVYLWELAERFGMIDTAFSRKMRKPFSKEETRKALQLIEEISAEKESGNHAGD